MPIRLVDHVNVATQRLEETRAFFVDVLGLVEGYRPDFGFAGHWLYAGDRAIVHLQQSDGPVGPSAASALNHVAFDISDFDVMVAKLEAHSVAYRAVAVPGTSIRQIFLLDPNGVQVELNYRPA
jgi:catechol 2,3-dioxygenase-like lactoylglutathione lyase family enzyme